MEPISPTAILSRFKPSCGRRILALGLGLAVLFPLAAQAQYYGRGWGPYGSPYGGPYGPYGGPGPGPYGGPGPGPYGGPPPYDPDDVGPAPDRGPGPGPRAGYGAPPPGPRGAAVVPVEVIEGRIRAAGYRLIAPPRHKGNIYLAEVEDSKLVRRRLLYDASDGHLLQNTPLGPAKKPGGPLQPETGRAPNGAEPTGKMGEPAGGDPADQAKAASPPPPEMREAPAAPASPPPHMDEPPPPAPNDGK